MLDINLIREKPEAVKDGIAKKNVDPKLVDKFLRLDTDWRAKTKIIDELKGEQNLVSDELAKEQKADLISKAQLLKQRIGDIESEREAIAAKRDELLMRLPNMPFADVPVGKNESENRVLREVGEKPHFDFKPLDYLVLGEKLGIIDTKKAAEVAGSRFGYLLGDAVLMEFALVELALKTLIKEGFTPVVPPDMIRGEVYMGMGALSAKDKEERYYLPKDELYLIGSAEHTLGPLHLNDVIAEEELPKRYVGFSACFRREAGSYGKDTKGILRVHQFDKVEMFSFSKPENSESEHQELLGFEEALMRELELPYRVMEICTGDMGWVGARQYDIETWMPGQDVYRETHSCSNTTDFQARGINAKYKTKNGKKEFVHTLNATAFAIGRTLIAILENYQTKQGTIRVPKALQAYVGKEEIGS
jgi:seryl-tRNA synthetase